MVWPKAEDAHRVSNQRNGTAVPARAQITTAKHAMPNKTAVGIGAVTNLLESSKLACLPIWSIKNMRLFPLEALLANLSPERTCIVRRALVETVHHTRYNCYTSKWLPDLRLGSSPPNGPSSVAEASGGQPPASVHMVKKSPATSDGAGLSFRILWPIARTRRPPPEQAPFRPWLERARVSIILTASRQLLSIIAQ